MHSVLVRLMNAETEIAYQTNISNIRVPVADLTKIYTDQLGYTNTGAESKVTEAIDSQPLENVASVYFSLMLLKQNQDLKLKYASAFNESCFYRQYLAASTLPYGPVAEYLNARHSCRIF